MVYLINVSASNNGKLIQRGGEKGNSWVYEHCIATYALAEGYTFCKQLGVNVPGLEEAVQKAGQRIIDGQNPAGGWTYRFEETNRNDTSVMGWAMQALKACKHTGIDFRNMNSCVRRGLEPSQRGDGTTLSAIGALCFQMWDKGSDSSARKACKVVSDNIKCKWDDPATDLYGHYYASQAMMNRGGQDWKKYNWAGLEKIQRVVP